MFSPAILRTRSGKILRRIFVGVLIITLLVIGVLAYFNAQRSSRETARTADIAPKTGHFIKTQDAEVFVQEAGSPENRAVLLIHGTGAWSEIWRETISSLVENNFYVVAIDVPPFGYSQKLPGSDAYTRDKQAQRIIDVLDSLNLKKVTLVGHSVGARPTLEVALSAPERIQELILIDPALGFDINRDNPRFLQNAPSWPVKSFFKLTWLRNAAVSAYATNPMFTRKVFSSFVSNKGSVTNARVTMFQQPMSASGTTESYADWLENLVTAPDHSLGSDFTNFKKLTMSVALIWGETDTVTPLWQGEALNKLIHGSSLRIIKNVGHIPYIEDPAAFNSVLLSILKKK